ncbi:CRISPR-associated protein [Bacillus methanolicus]|uniref:CRISPR-associated protein n=1 Tax=Bacillus methanolicus TaxID=1471 RepID=UPI0023807484|nr:CRISPR-associated protein [Bacillus methanolicus]MDE3840929.1 CRISPR-associated protein [Bacillus methanolicus]
MYHTVVMTCGVSLLTGESNVFSIKREGFPELHASLQEKEITSSINEEIEKWVRCAKRVVHEVKMRPKEVSAEFSMMYALRKRGKLSDRPTVILLLTKTVGGIITEKLLCYLFEKQFQADVKVLYVDIDVQNPKQLNLTIGEYMWKLSDALGRGEPNSTCFAPIGGYKVMTSFGYIVGSFLNYPTAYLHEYHQILHEIPPIPLDINDNFVHENIVLLRKCQKDYVKFEELFLVEQTCVEQYPSLFQKEEGLVGLTPFGQYLFERNKYEHLFNTRYFASKQVRAFMELNHHQSIYLIQQMRELVKKLKHGEGRLGEIMHEKQFSTINQQKVQYHLYKGASNGLTVFRLAYRYDEKEDALYANYLWLDHNRYEREAATGRGIYQSEQDFAEITDSSFVAMR